MLASEHLFALYLAGVRRQRPDRPHDPRRESFTVADMARAFDVSPQHAHAWRRGRTRIPGAVVVDMVAEFDGNATPWILALAGQYAKADAERQAFAVAVAALGGLPEPFTETIEPLPSTESVHARLETVAARAAYADQQAGDAIASVQAEREAQLARLDGESDAECLARRAALRAAWAQADAAVRDRAHRIVDGPDAGDVTPAELWAEVRQAQSQGA